MAFNPTAANWRAIGDVALAALKQELWRVSSPMLDAIDATYKAAQPHTGLFFAQAWLENQYKNTGHIIRPEHCNPVSLRPERIGDLGPYGYGLITAPDNSQFLVFRSDADCAREWKRRLVDEATTYKGGVYAATTTLETLLAVFTPSGDVHPVTGVDNADINYAATVRTVLNRYAALEADAGAKEQGGEPMATHRFILSAGHRNTDGGGAHREIEWTYPISVKLKQAIQRRGGKAWIIQEEDGDSDPTFCIGRGLQNAARLCVDLANNVGGVDAYISMHYEGGPARGFFGIFPDGTWSGVSDTRADNPLDERLCEVLAHHVEKTGMPKRTVGVVKPGVMSELQTGVGAQGYRLGEFVGTLGFRDKTARVILEGGNYVSEADRAMLWDAAWQDQYAEAIVDGLEEVFGKFSGTQPEPAPEPAPTPTPEPKPEYETASPIKEIADSRPFVALANGAVLVRADVVVEAVRDTPRLKCAGGSAKVGPDIAKGTQFATDYLIVNNDGSLYWYTPWATRVRYEDTRVIESE